MSVQHKLVKSTFNANLAGSDLKAVLIALHQLSLDTISALSELCLSILSPLRPYFRLVPLVVWQDLHIHDCISKMSFLLLRDTIDSDTARQVIS